MNRDVIAKRIAEFRRMQQMKRINGRPMVLETALFLEDVFDIVLDEDEIDDQNLGFEADLVALVLKKMEVG